MPFLQIKNQDRIKSRLLIWFWYFYPHFEQPHERQVKHPSW
jgi:hypothetical protein